MSGVEGWIYMKSSNTSDGRIRLDVNFSRRRPGHGNVTQNRVSSARRGCRRRWSSRVSLSKTGPSILMLISVNSRELRGTGS